MKINLKQIFSIVGEKKEFSYEIPAEEFSETILSLQHGNKMKKKYLAGIFGQGGSTANNFSQHTHLFPQ